MQLKKINTESDTYRIARGAAGSIGAVGSMFCLDSVVIPFVYALFPKKRLIRAVALFGLVGLNEVIGVIGAGGSKVVFDSYADTWNEVADKLNDKYSPEVVEVESDDKAQDDNVDSVKQFLGIDIPDKNASAEEETDFVNKVIGTFKPFEFDDKDSAMSAVEYIADLTMKNGFEDMSHALFNVFGVLYIPNEVYDIMVKFGWTRDDVKEFGVDYINEQTYVADLFNYHYIADEAYVVNPNFVSGVDVAIGMHTDKEA